MMNLSLRALVLVTAALLITSAAVAQIPVEVFGGHKKATIDIMFFKYFKNQSGDNSRFLFFNRNRASIDYNMTKTTNLPQFGFTEAISYNYEKLKGFAPVFVTQVFGTGVYTKAGFQYASIKKDFLFFSWFVSETKKKPTLDLFFLGRYTPRLTEELNLFTQFELVNAFPATRDKNFIFTQRVRLGIKMKAFQFGIAADFSEIGRRELSKINNLGGFLRYEY